MSVVVSKVDRNIFFAVLVVAHLCDVTCGLNCIPSAYITKEISSWTPHLECKPNRIPIVVRKANNDIGNNKRCASGYLGRRQLHAVHFYTH